MASRRPPPPPHPPQAPTSSEDARALVVFLLPPQPADPNNCLGGTHARRIHIGSTRTHIRAIHLASCQPSVQSWNFWRRESRLLEPKHPLASTHGALLPSSLPVYLLIAPSHSSFPSIPYSFVTSISLSSTVPELFRGAPIKTTRLLYMTLINSHKFLASPPHYKTPRDICGPVARDTGTGDTDDNSV